MTYPIRKDIAESHSMFVLARFRYNIWYFAFNGGKGFYRHVLLLHEVIYKKKKEKRLSSLEGTYCMAIKYLLRARILTCTWDSRCNRRTFISPPVYTYMSLSKQSTMYFYSSRKLFSRAYMCKQLQWCVKESALLLKIVLVVLIN